MDKKSKSSMKFSVRDNKQAWEVKKVDPMPAQMGVTGTKPYVVGNKGYPAEAWNYKY